MPRQPRAVAGLSEKHRRPAVRPLRAVFAMLFTVTTFSTTFAAPPAEARSVIYNLNIPAQSLDSALQAFALVSHHRLLYKSALVEGRTAPALKGEFTTEEAMRMLLSSTPQLTFDVTPSAVVLIRSKSDKYAPARITGRPAQEREKETSQKGDGFRVAETGQRVAASTNSLGPQVEQETPAVLQEVVVTAEKRSERLMDVPVPVAVVDTDALADNDRSKLQDYFSSVPGFSLSPAAGEGNAQTIAIRGIVAGSFTNPTVGVTVDGVPYGSSIKILGNVIPDMDPGDLARVEVLRGPQGTLYGASSMGGLINFVTVDPSTSRFSGRGQAGVNGVVNGAEAGYTFRGAANVPLSDTLAVRASAFTRQDPGYIDNPMLDEKGVNEDRVYGGRVSGLWRPSDTLSVKLGALYQDTKGDGLPDVIVERGLGDLQQNYARGVGAWEKQIQAYSAIVTAKLGNATITSVSGYNVNKWSNSIDVSFFGPLFGYGGYSIPLLSAGTTNKFTQELRATVPLGQRFEWLIGGFYTHENSPVSETVPVLDPATLAPVASLGASSTPSTYAEDAAFTDLTVHFTDRFDVQFGGRESHIRQTFEPVVETGPLFGGATVIPTAEVNADAFTYLLTPRFRVTPDLMVYARAASGYRPGGSNNFNPDPAIPRSYKPDKTENYEIGAKGDVLNHILMFDASVYYIDWKDIQLTLHDLKDNQGYGTNGSRARSEGVELSLKTVPLAGVTTAAWVTYDDASLTESFPPDPTLYGVAGSRLPYTARWSGNLAIDDNFRLTRDLAGFVGGQVSYVGDRLGIFTATPQRQVYPSYAEFDLHGGVTFESWRINLYVNNVADKRGLIGGGLGTSLNPHIFYYIQPRTIGLSISKSL